MKTVHAAGIVTYYKKDNTIFFLLLHHTNGNHWDFPKGKVESGETKQETARRELHEETGLTVDCDTTFTTSTHYITQDIHGKTIQKKVFFFLGESNTQDITLSHEHHGALWLTYEQAHEKITYNTGKKILKKAWNFLNIF